MPDRVREVSSHPDSLVDRTARSPNLDVLRAIAALMVLFGHAYSMSGRVVISQADGALLSARWLIDTSLIFAYSGVWLFFGLSGYLITAPFVRSVVLGTPRPRVAPYAIRRVARIYPLYWAAFVATVATLGYAAFPSRYVGVHLLLLQNLVPGQESAGISAAWTLTLELLFYLAVPVGAWLLVRLSHGRPMSPERLALVILAVWAGSLAFGQLAALSDDAVHQTWLRFVLPATLCMFCPGILLSVATHATPGTSLHLWLRDLPQRRVASLVAAVALSAAAAMTAGARPGPRGPDSAYWATLTLGRLLFAVGFGIVIVRALSARPWGGRLHRPLLELGLISYGVYLIHYVTVRALALTDRGRSLIPLPHGGAAAYLAHVSLLLAMTIPLAWASWYRLERPMLRWAIKRAGGADQDTGSRSAESSERSSTTPSVDPSSS